jgi:hypothetical protein
VFYGVILLPYRLQLVVIISILKILKQIARINKCAFVGIFILVTLDFQNSDFVIS